MILLRHLHLGRMLDADFHMEVAENLFRHNSKGTEYQFMIHLYIIWMELLL